MTVNNNSLKCRNWVSVCNSIYSCNPSCECERSITSTTYTTVDNTCSVPAEFWIRLQLTSNYPVCGGLKPWTHLKVYAEGSLRSMTKAITSTFSRWCVENRDFLCSCILHLHSEGDDIGISPWCLVLKDNKMMLPSGDRDRRHVQLLTDTVDHTAWQNGHPMLPKRASKTSSCDFCINLRQVITVTRSPLPYPSHPGNFSSSTPLLYHPTFSLLIPALKPFPYPLRLSRQYLSSTPPACMQCIFMKLFWIIKNFRFNQLAHRQSHIISLFLNFNIKLRDNERYIICSTYGQSCLNCILVFQSCDRAQIRWFIRLYI